MTERSTVAPIIGVLLAAGSASRFGGGKLLAPLADGTELGVQALKSLIAGVDGVVAVVRTDDDTLARALANAGAQVTVCPHAAHGMGRSLAWAIRATPIARGWVVALADMPWIRTATMQRIADALRQGDALVAASHQGVRGHPVGFARQFYGKLASLGGDEGAKTILHAHVAELRLIDTDDAGVALDVDTPADLAH